MAANVQEVDLQANLDILEDNIQGCIDCSVLSSNINIKNKLLNIFHLNIRSINKNFDQFMVFLEAYSLHLTCDIIILSECWSINSEDQYNIRDYNRFYNYANYNKNDGIVIFIKSELNAVVTNMKLERTGITFSRICLDINNVKYGVTCVYRPPSTNIKSFIYDLEQYISSNTNKQIELFIGDININILQKNDYDTNLYLSTLNFYGFESTINGPTRVTSNTSTCLDHIFLKNKLKSNAQEYSTFIIETDLTDHFPIMINIYSDYIVRTNDNKTVTKTVEKFNELLFRDQISKQSWTTVFGSNSVEEAAEEFSYIMENIVDQSKERKNIVVKENKKLKPWITQAIISSIKTRDKMKKKLLKNYSIEYEQSYKDYRNNLCRIMNKCKYDYFRNQIDNNKNNLKKIYQIISVATDGKQNKKDNIFHIKDNDGNQFTNNTDMANYCNKFFIEIGTKMQEKISKPENKFKIQYNSTSSMFLSPVSNEELIMHIKSLKNNAAPGPDGITSKLIKKFHKFLLEPLKFIINLCFETGRVPKCFKTSIVTPIHKSDDKAKITNYRPITVINNFSKIFEKCLRDRLYEFYVNNNILSKNQFGFCSGLSTTDAICELTGHITNNLDTHKKCLSVFLDLAKAFDTVPHDSLLGVLETYGIRGSVLGVFESYLVDRMQRLRMGDVLSDSLKIQIGIPQGTVLGPLLFNSYINSLTNMNILGGKVVSYADDTVVIFTGETWEEVFKLTGRGIKEIKYWLDSFSLTLNLKKTNYIAYSLTAANRPYFNSIPIEGWENEIKEVEFTKYLGVNIDRHLKWNHHILALSKNIRKLIHKFYTLREIMGAGLLIDVYRAIVESLLRYAIVVWGGLYNNALQQLNVVQNFILKIIYKRNRTYPTEMLYNKELLNMRSLYILNVCILVQKNKHKKIYIQHSYITRNASSRSLVIPNSSTNLKLRYLTYLAPKIYNLVPLEIRSLSNLNKFIIGCKTFITDNAHKFLELF